ncbi:MAG: glycosyltransferase family 4 protein [Eubacteriales bacterium]|nr:glycosyltransferase family 4 protein [Eubacteriales bacterium]
MSDKPAKKNIAMFGHKRIPSREGGVEIVVEELATRLAQQSYSVTCYNRRGHHVSDASFDTKKIKEYKGVKIKSVLTIDKKGLAAVTSSFFAALRCAFSRVKVVHIHAEGPAAMTLLLKIFRKRVVVTVHGLDWQREKWSKGFASKYIRFGEKMAVKFADEIIVLSNRVKDYFKDTYNRDTVYIPNGVNAPEILDAQRIKEQFKLFKDSYILFLGRLVPEKGVHLLIDAFKDVKTEKKLVIAGGASDTDDYVAKLYESAKDDERIVFTGFQQGEMLQELFSNAYVYALPSLLEGMPLSLLEAMSYKNCCLVSDIAECTEVVEDKAVVVKAGDVSELTKTLQTLCDDEEKVKSYKQSAREFILSKYNWDNVVDKTLALYKK